MASSRTFDDLIAIMDRLREPDGCPWDREQTYATLRGYLVEECYEVVDALDRADLPGLREELGDLLFQIVFLSRLGKEDGAFTAADVVEGIAAKMVRRHPHVFGSDTVSGTSEVLARWEEIKKAEKKDVGAGATASVLDGIPHALPALVKAQRLGTKASRVGFDWSDDEGVLSKLDEECGELREAVRSGRSESIAEELGDTLFTLAMLARRLDLDADAALARANDKFRRRFVRVEDEVRKRGLQLQDAGPDLMNQLWEEAKAALRE
jgi:MazG family protein